jgi:hemolysin (HlyC) family protein
VSQPAKPKAAPPAPPTLGARWRALLRSLARPGAKGDVRERLAEVIAETGSAVTGKPLGRYEREMLLNVLKCRELRLKDIMVPRADIVAVEIKTPFDRLVKKITRGGHSRLPVYRGSLDDIAGMVHVKDVLEALNKPKGARALEALVREVIVVPPSMRLFDLLRRMRGQRIHMAVVVDEFGGTDGLVTIEDLVEQVVGEIADEYDEAETPGLTLIGKGVYEASARLPLAEFEIALKTGPLAPAGEEAADTVGGLVAGLAGRVPAVGEAVSHPSGLRFEVLEADPRRIKRLRVHAPLGGE